MGALASVDGQAQIGETNAPDFGVNVSLTTGTITKSQSGKQIVLNNVAAQSFDIFTTADMANAHFIYVNSVDDSDDPVKVNLRMTGAGDVTLAVDVTCFILAIGVAGAQFTKATVLIPANNGDTYISWAIAGS